MPTLLFPKYEEAFIIVSQYLSMFSSGIEEFRAYKDLQVRFKEKRRGLSKQEIDNRSLDIYPKKGTPLVVFLLVLASEELIDVLNVNDEQHLKLSKKGLERLKEIYTDNFSTEKEDEQSSFFHDDLPHR